MNEIDPEPLFNFWPGITVGDLAYKDILLKIACKVYFGCSVINVSRKIIRYTIRKPAYLQFQMNCFVYS